MAETVFSAEGHFQMWSYDVSHARLLVRRNIRENASRIDLLFFDVCFLQCPTEMDSVSIDVIGRGEASKEFPDCVASLPASLKRFLIRFKSGKGLIIAGGITSHEDRGRYDDPSAIYQPGGLMRDLAKNGYSS
jgi:hypothetical protein